MHPEVRADSLLKRLAGGDRRSVGDADRVAELARGDAVMIAQLVRGLRVDDPLVRMRAADALEKATREASTLLAPHKATILAVLESSDQAEVQWQLVQCVPRLPLAPAEQNAIIGFLQRFFRSHTSRILRTNCLQALYDLAPRSPMAMVAARDAIERGLADPAPSVRARARRLQGELTDANVGGATS